MSKTTITLSVILALVVGVIAGHSFWSSESVNNLAGATATSTAGTVNATAKIASVAMNPITSAASSTFILNNSGTDRVIRSTDVFCDSLGSSKVYLTGGGLANFSVNISTSSDGSQNGNSNYAANIQLTTTTPTYYVSSSTEGVPASGAGRLWANGSYQVITFNATNTAACTVQMNLMSL